MTNPSLTLMLLLSVLCGGFWNSIKGQCDHPDFDALVALYNSTEGPNWYNNNGWVEGVAGTNCDLCSWYGIQCDEQNRVNRITLNTNRLSGNIPVEIGDLLHITSLFLSTNRLDGSIPLELGNLSNLTFLSLDRNQLSGSIPETLENLTNLSTLNFEMNQLDGIIPSELGNLVNLGQLNLSYNQLSGNIPETLGGLSNLSILNLQSNQLSGSIPQVLGNLYNLTWLNLYGNQLSGSIPETLGSLSNLEGLWLAFNQLSGSIPAELGNLSNLTTLFLSVNQLSGNIPPELGNLSKLERFYLQNNKLSGCFPPELQTHCSLGFSAEDITQVGYNLTGNPSLPWGGDFTRFCDGEGNCDPTHTTAPNQAHKIVLFPNPSSDFINISETEDIVSIELLSPQGVLLNTFSTSFGRLDVSRLSSGLYLLQIKTKNGSAFAHRFVKI